MTINLVPGGRRNRISIRPNPFPASVRKEAGGSPQARFSGYNSYDANVEAEADSRQRKDNQHLHPLQQEWLYVCALLYNQRQTFKAGGIPEITLRSTRQRASIIYQDAELKGVDLPRPDFDDPIFTGLCRLEIVDPAVTCPRPTSQSPRPLMRLLRLAGARHCRASALILRSSLRWSGDS